MSYIEDESGCMKGPPSGQPYPNAPLLATGGVKSPDKVESLVARVNWPEEVRVSGLPLFVQGWNRIYRRYHKGGIDDTPIYTFDSYVLYWWFFGGFNIVPAQLFFSDGQWHLSRFDGVLVESTKDSYFVEPKSHYNKLFDRWPRFVTVSPTTKHAFWNLFGY